MDNIGTESNYVTITEPINIYGQMIIKTDGYEKYCLYIKNTYTNISADNNIIKGNIFNIDGTELTISNLDIYTNTSTGYYTIR
jgi:gamma-glutamylcyclotransferase (GGCT)/AIG2-like uncharacterized protein YtfP